MPFFKELRANRPILVTPDCTLVTRFDDVREILTMYKVFTVKPYYEPPNPKMDPSYLIANDDNALHTREKSLMQFMLNRDDLPRVRNLVAEIASGILDDAKGKIEIVNSFCRMVPATLVQKYFGLTGAKREDLIEWSYWNQYDTFHNQPFDLVPTDISQQIINRHNETSKKLGDYIVMLIAKRLPAVKLEKLTFSTIVRLDDDIVTRMLRTSFAKTLDFDIKQLGINAGGLLIGAIETTSQAVAQVLQYLFQHSQWLAMAKAAAQKEDTTEFDGIVWEALRFVPITSYLFRTTASDYMVGEGTEYKTVLRANTYVLLVTLSAMFDERAFESPDEFIPQRNWYNYFHFGFGAHQCLGRYVGMVMIPEMVRQVLLKKDIEPKGNIEYKNSPFLIDPKGNIKYDKSPFPEVYNLSWIAA